MNVLNILYLEDSPQDAEMTSRILKKAGINFNLTLVDKEDEYKQALKQLQPDIVLADHSLVHFNSVEALKLFKSIDLQIPFILVTGTVSEEFAVLILNEGANDYVLKDNLSRLPSAMLNALEKFRMKREREAYLENLIANEKMLKQAEELAYFGSWEMDIITKTCKWSDEMYRIYGYEPGEIQPSLDIFLKHVHPDDSGTIDKKFNGYLPENDTVDLEFRIINKHNIIREIHGRRVIERNPGGEPVKQLGFIQDVTERKDTAKKLLTSLNDVSKLEKDLIKHQLEQQKLITEVTINAQEKERNELAKELHDNINQMLAIVKMYLHVAKEDKSATDEMVDRCCTIVEQAIDEIRKLSKSLLAPSLGDIGIFEALNDLVQEMNLSRKFNVNLDLENRNYQTLDSNIELMLYRIVQEQLNNIIKYALAKDVKITLKISPATIFLSIYDNGNGFDTKKKANGIGLKNIRSRVEFYSGTVNINSSPGNGCIIEITIPIPKEADQKKI